MNRREMILKSGITGLAVLSGLSDLRAEAKIKEENDLKIIAAGAHPDDPETGCGGTIKLLTDAGHEVICYYLTTGQAGIKGVSHTETEKIRKAEAQEACSILGAQAVFGKQIDGATEINKKRFTEILDFIESRQPDMVFTHWPIDTHADHRVCSNLFYNAFLRSSKSFDLFYYEVMTGHQTQNFNPETFVDIASVANIKHQACFVHKSQKIKEEYAKYHGLMEKFRGAECYSQYGEAFIRQRPYGLSFMK